MSLTLATNVFDVWTFQRTAQGIRFLLLHTSEDKAQRFFNGGRFWQIPSDFVKEDEHVSDAIGRVMRTFALKPQAIWAAEHTYTIYNRRFNEMQLIGVYATEVLDAPVRLNASEHAESAWLSLDECLSRVHFRGLKDGLRSVHEYITEPLAPARELCLYSAIQLE